MSEEKAKRGDIGVGFSGTLEAEGLSDLDDVASVLFLLRNVATGTVISKSAQVSDSANLRVSYVSQIGDLAVSGIYRQEWELTFNDGAIRTFPSDDYNLLRVLDDLNP